MLSEVPEVLRATPGRHEAAAGSRSQRACSRICEAAVRRLVALPAATPSLRLLADQAAEALARHFAGAQRARLAVPINPRKF